MVEVLAIYGKLTLSETLSQKVKKKDFVEKTVAIYF